MHPVSTGKTSQGFELRSKEGTALATDGLSWQSIWRSYRDPMGEVQRRKKFKYKQALEKDDLGHEDSNSRWETGPRFWGQHLFLRPSVLGVWPEFWDSPREHWLFPPQAKVGRLRAFIIVRPR